MHCLATEEESVKKAEEAAFLKQRGLTAPKHLKSTLSRQHIMLTRHALSPKPYLVIVFLHVHGPGTGQVEQALCLSESLHVWV